MDAMRLSYWLRRVCRIALDTKNKNKEREFAHRSANASFEQHGSNNNSKYDVDHKSHYDIQKSQKKLMEKLVSGEVNWKTLKKSLNDEGRAVLVLKEEEEEANSIEKKLCKKSYVNELNLKAENENVSTARKPEKW